MVSLPIAQLPWNVSCSADFRPRVPKTGSIPTSNPSWTSAAAGWTVAPCRRERSLKTTKLRILCGAIRAHWIVIGNGILDARRPAPDSVAVTAIGDSEVPAHDSALADFNTALLGDGIRIRIADDMLDRPLGILCIDHADGQPHVTQTRVIIEVAPGKIANVVEYHTSDGDSDHFANAIVDIALDRDASATFIRIQDRNKRHAQTHKTSVRLADRSRLHYSGFDLGGRLIRNDLDVCLAGKDADVDIGGLYVAGDGQHLDNHVRVDHAVGPARSAQEYRGILGGKCRCVWNGKAIVQPGADGTDAEQGNHNLLLSEHAEIDAKPELEIYADEVKCAHGTTVGQLDEDALFYLRTRGLDELDARNALTHAFGANIVSRLSNQQLIDLLTNRIESRLDGIAAGAAE